MSDRLVESLESLGNGPSNGPLNGPLNGPSNGSLQDKSESKSESKSKIISSIRSSSPEIIDVKPEGGFNAIIDKTPIRDLTNESMVAVNDDDIVDVTTSHQSSRKSSVSIQETNNAAGNALAKGKAPMIYFPEPAPPAPLLLKRKTKDDEIVFIRHTPAPAPAPFIPPPNPLGNDTVCYGMLEWPVLYVNRNHLRMDYPLSTAIPVKVFALRVQNDPHYTLQFYEIPGLPIAQLPDLYCRQLAAVIRSVKMECRLLINGDKNIVKVVFYGKLNDGAAIGAHFNQNQHKFLPPDIQPKLQYHNPQQVFKPAYELQQVVGTKVEKQIKQLYKTLTAPQDLKERAPDPRLISTLFKYQKQALYWMYEKEQCTDLIFWKKEGVRSWRNIITGLLKQEMPNPIRGGILADDMGLGKTIQVISLILKNEPKRTTGKKEVIDDDDVQDYWMQKTKAPPMARDFSFGFVPPAERVKTEEPCPEIGNISSKATLIICPLSTINNWEDQIATHTEPGSLRVLVHHGSNRTDDPAILASYDIVITTYNIIGLGFGQYSTPLHKVYWYRIVLDEAHIIKSSSTIQAKAAFQFKADIRWCLTGTPIQNKLDDLYSLVKFLRIEPLEKRAEWQFHISKAIAQAKSPAAFSKLQILMKGITLRREKDDLIDGKPIITLPKRKEMTMLLDLEPSEREIYDRVHAAGRMFFERLRDKGQVMNHYVTILKAILMMRQACLHPSLVKMENLPSFEKFVLPEDDDDEDIISLDTPVSLETATKLFQFLKHAGEDVCVFCNNAVEGAGVCMTPCKHLVCSGCTQSVITSSKTDVKKETASHCPLCRIRLTMSMLTEIPEGDIDGPDDDKAEAFANDFKLELPNGNLPTKLRALINDLEQVRASDQKGGRHITKSIVFSQFTTMLTLCEKPLLASGFQFVRLDGQMNRNQRSHALQEFKTNPRVTVFLMSIKAGGVGLNLVAATRVYLLEPQWNPAIEQQAIDRVWRLGQTREVTTIRMIISNSVEINMQERQRYKTALAEKAFDQDGLEDETDVSGSSSKSQKPQESMSKKVRKLAREVILQMKLESLAILFRK